MNLSLNQLHEAFLRLTGSGVASVVSVESVESVPAATGSTASAVPPAPAPPASPCQIVDPKAKGYHLDVKVASDQVVAAAELANQYGFAIDTITGVDWMAAGEMEIVYDFFHFEAALHLVVRTRVPRATPALPTISGVYPGANWHERETHDFFGIEFLGHPDLSPLLLPEDATYHPLRKDFAGVN
jgi:NADH-quinone oxidoreductase subunit C